MSQFPKRLIDELGEGQAQRLLRSARTDEPPARLVAAAIVRASTSTHPAESAPPASGTSRRNTALIAGSLVAGALALWATTRLLTPGPVPSREAHPSIVSAGAPVEAKRVEESAEPTVHGTAVSDLPNAPPPPARSPSSAGPVATTNTTTPLAAEQPTDLLREANRLRAGGHWAEAAATYRKVIDLGPESAEAYPADVALGNLQLQQNQPLAALARYEHALASHPNGALAEEARWGKARALRAAGRTVEERAALHEFQARHSNSPLLPIATQRLAELGD